MHSCTGRAHAAFGQRFGQDISLPTVCRLEWRKLSNECRFVESIDRIERIILNYLLCYLDGEICERGSSQLSLRFRSWKDREIPSSNYRLIVSRYETED